MLLILSRGIPESEASGIASRLRMFGLSVHRSEFQGEVRLGAVGDDSGADWAAVRRWKGVAEVTPFPRPFQLASRTFHPQPTVITVGRCAIGSDQLALMA